LTTKGVDNLVKYWLGQQGFKPFIDNLKTGEA
jgi:Na+-transporting NADH:ubiquinone oxidoreductase subunit C